MSKRTISSVSIILQALSNLLTKVLALLIFFDVDKFLQ